MRQLDDEERQQQQQQRPPPLHHNKVGQAGGGAAARSGAQTLSAAVAARAGVAVDVSSSAADSATQLRRGHDSSCNTSPGRVHSGAAGGSVRGRSAVEGVRSDQDRQPRRQLHRQVLPHQALLREEGHRCNPTTAASPPSPSPLDSPAAAAGLMSVHQQVHLHHRPRLRRQGLSEAAAAGGGAVG